MRKRDRFSGMWAAVLAAALLMMGHMDKLTTLPDIYRHVMPRFFFRHKDFFRHFLLTLQTTSTEGNIYPTITLDYLPAATDLAHGNSNDNPS